MESKVKELLELTTKSERKVIKYAYNRGKSITVNGVEKALNLERDKARRLVYNLYKKNIFRRRFKETGPTTYITLYSIKKEPYKEAISLAIKNNRI